MEARWTIRESDPALSHELARRLSVSDALSSILIARGIRDVEGARVFLDSRLDSLHDPFLFKDMEKASGRILHAVMKREKILIYGDYDADGMSSIALLYSLLRMVGAEADYHVPDRLTEGYGMKAQRIRQAASDGVKLIITVDCGIASAEEITLANELGMDTVITDHHEPGGELPPAFAVLNPKVSGCTYPFRELAGVGVAFKLAWGIAQSFSPTKRVSEEFRNFLLDALALVALGTVADVVPLVDENRVFVKFGLKALAASANPGLRAMLDSTGLSGSLLRANHIAFRIAPRLNAAGRMGKAHLGMDLLTTGSTLEAEKIASELERQNRRRQTIEKRIFKDALDQVSERGSRDEKLVVLSGEGWHAGVIGIVASKLADMLYRPVVLIAMNGPTGRGTARSVEKVHIYELLRRCSESLIGFGGHKLAAGFEIEAGRLEAFRAQLTGEADRFVSEESLRKCLTADLDLPLADLTLPMVRELERLRPHGERNPAPLFVSTGVRVAGRPHTFGRNSDHLAVQLVAENAFLRAVGFGMAGVAEKLDNAKEISVAYVPKINSWDGLDTLEIELRDIALDGQSLVAEDE